MKRFKYLTLAALVAFAACDEGADTVVVPPVTGTVSGVVTIEGSAANGVTVTLSSGTTTTTSASGAYSFTGVTAGAHTVTISGFASDASFSATVKAVTISTAGQVATANFDGSYIRTSAILGSVSGGGSGLSGVTVALSGQSSASTTTDSNGQYSFSGLRAGNYTVTISGFSSSTYSFSSTSKSVTLSVGQSQVASFSGTLVTTAKISGTLFLDENNKDDVFSSGIESALKVANIGITIEGGAVNNLWTVQTDANGVYTLPNLAAGTYRVTIDAADADIPSMVTFGGTNNQLVTITTGATGVVNFPFDITTQRIDVSGFLGIDGTKPGITPISGWTINLYNTQANAAAGGATGRIGTGATGTDGKRTFRFLRTADTSPNSAAVDNVVFAQIAGAPTATHTVNGETIIEIKYNPNDSIGMAPDTFDALYSAATIALRGEEIDGDKLSGWQVSLRANKDTTGATTMSGATNAQGFRAFDITPANLAATTDGALPDTIYMRLSTTQAAANGHTFRQTPSATEGTVAGGQVKFIWDGTVGPNDTIWIGKSTVKYLDVDVLFGVHHEKDDSTNVPTFTKGDATASVGAGSVVQLYNNSTGTPVVASAAVAPGSAGAPWKAWERPMFNIPVENRTWQIRARTTDGNLVVLNDSLINFTLEGDDQVDTIAPLKGGGGTSTFALKAKNTSVTGTILSVDGAAAVSSMRVRVKSTADNIQPRGGGLVVDTTVKTSAAGTYTVANLREGPYTVSVEDSTGVWHYMVTLKTTTQAVNTAALTVPIAGTEKGGNVVANTDARTGTRDNEGYGTASVVNFAAHRMDTKVQGVVVNDRDSDYNTLDPDEALSGVTVELIDDADRDGVVDSGEAVLATMTTDASGAYGFSALKEDNYIVRATSPSNATVLRALSGTGAVTNTLAVLTAGSTGAGATLNQNGRRQVGNMSPPAQNDEFPRWNYLTGTAAADGGNLGGGAGPNRTNGALTTTPTHFVHLFNTGTVKGKIETNAGTGVAGVRVTITRCQTLTGFATPPSPPAGLGGGACAKHGVPSPHIKNADTDAGGNYTFSNLLEGVYVVEVAPATGGYSTNEGPDSLPATDPGDSGDQIMVATVQGNNDVETVPDYVIS